MWPDLAGQEMLLPPLDKLVERLVLCVGRLCSAGSPVRSLKLGWALSCPWPAVALSPDRYLISTAQNHRDRPQLLCLARAVEPNLPQHSSLALHALQP